MTEHFEARLSLPVPVDAAWRWLTRPGALERLSPPWEDTRVLQNDGVRDGGRTILEIAIGPVHEKWIALHRDVQPNRSFVDEQVSGPFKEWVHTHRLEPAGDHCVLVDSIDYRMPLGALGRLVGGNAVRHRLDRMFAYRHAVMLDDLRRHAGTKPLIIAMSGATGLIARALVPMLTAGGHTVLPLVRRAPGASEIAWDPDRGAIESDKLGGVDAVVHLAGESIGDGRWTDEKKRAIKESRVRGTALLAETLATLSSRPRVFVSASAIGWYGDRKEPVDETSPRGEGFLAEVCEAWERAADPARAAGVRVVHPRTGIVLTPQGGALPQMMTAFKLGVGGRIGEGTQGMSWISIDDEVAALHVAIVNDALAGPINLTAPEPVDAATFAKIVGEVMHRPSAIPLPEAAVKLALGERGRSLLLDGAFVLPRALTDAGHRFAYPDLASALRHLLGRT